MLCSHAPPAVPELAYDVVSRRSEAPSAALLDRIRRDRPRAALFGHVHQPLAQRCGWAAPSASTSGTSARRPRPTSCAGEPPVTCRAMADATSSSITIAAPPERVMAVIADFAGLPGVGRRRSTAVEVLDTGADGRAEQVRFTMDAGPDQGLVHVGLHVGARRPVGQLDLGQGADPEGAERLVRARRQGPDSTTVTYSLAVDLNIPMIGMLRRKAEKVIIDTALKGLKRRVGGTASELTSVRAGRAVHRQGRGRQDDARRGHGRPPRPAGRKALVVSTDPAHSLGDALEAELGGEPAELETPGCSPPTSTPAPCSTSAWGQLQRHLRTVLAGAGRRRAGGRRADRAARASRSCSRSAEVRRAAESGPWEVVVVDCGPDRGDAAAAGAARSAVAGYLERLFPAHRRAVRGLLAGLSGGGRDARRAGTRRSTPSTGWPSSSPGCARCSPTTRAPRSGWC